MPVNASVTLSFIADFYRRYPGEEITYSAQVTVHQAAHYGLTIMLPAGVRFIQAQPAPTSAPFAEVDGPTTVHWEQQEADAQAKQTYRVVVQIEPFDLLWRYEQRAKEEHNENKLEEIQPYYHQSDVKEKEPASLRLFSCAYIDDGVLDIANRADLAPEHNFVRENVLVTVYAKSSYMKHLPALYEQDDDFIARFLMLFESFWSPIQQQIEHIYNYFDLDLTPPELLKWIGSWFDLELPDHWTEDRQRALVRQIFHLHQQRGTRRGLETYLKLITGTDHVQITEYSAHPFHIGPSARLGSGIAFGSGGRPHTFSVQIKLPKSNHQDMQGTALSQVMARDKQIIEAIIDAEKPAHTAYTLSIEYQ